MWLIENLKTAKLGIIGYNLQLLSEFRRLELD